MKSRTGKKQTNKHTHKQTNKFKRKLTFKKITIMMGKNVKTTEMTGDRNWYQQAVRPG